MAARILVVEDEEHLHDVIKLNLEMEGYEVITAVTGSEAIELFNGNKVDLVLLDIMLPEVDGFTVCQTIRLKDAKVPIIIITAKNSSADRVQGLRYGADDYLSKPFNLEELLLRVNNMLRRSRMQDDSVAVQHYNFGGNEVNFATFEIKGHDGVTATLSEKECRLLRLLIERKNEVISREEILETVWGYNVYPSTRTIDNYILAFRKYFEQNPKQPAYFHSVRGVGYKFSD